MLKIDEKKITIKQKIKKFEAEVPKPETKKEENVAEVARKILKFEEMMKNPRIVITEEKPRNLKLNEKIVNFENPLDEAGQVGRVLGRGGHHHHAQVSVEAGQCCEDGQAD